MTRPRRDGTPSRMPNRRSLTEFYLNSIKPDADRTFAVWDTKQRGLALLVQRSGHRAWKAVYSMPGRGPRWYHIGDVGKIGLADARRLAARVMLKVAEGLDPHGDRIAERGVNTFAELATKYVEQHAKKKNKSWRQAAALIERHALPRWSKLKATTISRADVKALMASIDAPIMANQVLASVSAIFTWAVKEEIVVANPCKLVACNPTKSRQRVLGRVGIAAIVEGARRRRSSAGQCSPHDPPHRPATRRGPAHAPRAH